MAAEPQQLQDQRVSLERLRVLLADEDLDALERLSALLEERGHDVVAESVNVADVADLIVTTDPDLAMVRLHRDIEHALALIDQASSCARGPVLALLDESDADFAAAAAEQGVDAVVHPVTGEAVQAAIEVAMRRHAEVEALGEKVEQLETALQRRSVIERAKGILMERHGVDERAAFELLRSHARSTNRKVLDVARGVAAGHALLPKA